MQKGHARKTCRSDWLLLRSEIWNLDFLKVNRTLPPRHCPLPVARGWGAILSKFTFFFSFLPQIHSPSLFFSHCLLCMTLYVLYSGNLKLIHQIIVLVGFGGHLTVQAQIQEEERVQSVTEKSDKITAEVLPALCSLYLEDPRGEAVPGLPQRWSVSFTTFYYNNLI